MLFLLTAAVFFLSFSNGANDNFKGVATLRKSRHYSFRNAIVWGTAWTALGSLGGRLFASKLLPVFSGTSLIREGVNVSTFVLAVGAGAALTIFLAARIGMPISTTHALAGALTGVAILSGGWANFHPEVLGRSVFLPLLLSPLLAIGITLSVFPLVRRVFPAQRDCICVNSAQLAPAMNSTGTLAFPLQPQYRMALPTLTIDTASACAVHSPKAQWRADVNELVHWFSGGLISFSRGMNDTPKIAALLLAPSLGGSPGIVFLGVALAMLAGGMLGARKVAKTISEDVTDIQTAEGTGANLVTAILVGLASPLGLPVSTTHIAVGSIIGIGLSQQERTNWRKVREIFLAWVFTIPVALLLGSAIYLLLR